MLVEEAPLTPQVETEENVKTKVEGNVKSKEGAQGGTIGFPLLDPAISHQVLTFLSELVCFESISMIPIT